MLPDTGGLIVLEIHRGIQALGIQADPFRRGQELPAPRNGFLLEIITEGEIPQHLKKGAVPCRLADVLDVAGADAFLAGADPAAGRLLLALEPGLHRGHARIDEQEARIVLRYQRETGQAQMAFGFKEAQKHLTQFIQSVVFHLLSSDPLRFFVLQIAVGPRRIVPLRIKRNPVWRQRRRTLPDC